MTARDQGPLARLAANGRARMTVGAAVVLVIVALAVAVLLAALSSAGSVARPVPEATPVPGGTFSIAEGGSANEAPVLVHVLGEVRSPGLYELHDSARVLDAIAAAGGLTEAADSAAMNLARRVADGEQLIVPRVGAAPVAGTAGSVPAGPLSLSTASAEQLEELPRIGPTIAQRIVDWREAGGRFTSVDDLLEVDGVGQKMVDALRDLVVP